MGKLYTDEQIDISIDKLNKELADEGLYNGPLFQTFCNTSITQDFTKKSLKRINVKSVDFIKSCFLCVAATGSKFTKCKFVNCDMSGANFQYCYFNKVHFLDDTIIHGSNFSHSVFIDCVFENIIIERSTLYDCHFEKCSFENSVIKSNTMENTAIHNSEIEDIDLAHINLEYMLFDNVYLKNVILPPYQVPYIIGAPTYVMNTADEVYFYTDSEVIDRKKYISFFDDLIVYYYSHGEYFAMANLYIAFNKYDSAYECILDGIREASLYFDFRIIKHFCRLACASEHFTHIQLKNIYDFISDLSCNPEWDINTLHFYLLNIGEIREILLNNYVNKHRVEFTIKTNIDKEDISSVNSFYQHLNIVLREYCSTSHVDAIEIRHNSPYEFFVTCVDALPHLLTFISAMYTALAGTSKFIDGYKKIEEIRQLRHENEVLELEKEEKRLHIEREKIEIEKLKKATSNEQTASGILIVREIEHNLKCNTFDGAKSIAPEYLHYKFKNS